jgi:hypothetical protein
MHHGCTLQGALELEAAARQLAEGREKDHQAELEASRGRIKAKSDELDQLQKSMEVGSRPCCLRA